MMEKTLARYLPQDRLRALARGYDLPDRTSGSALLADIVGFTSLSQDLVLGLGPRRGVQDLAQQLNEVYDVLIAEVVRYGGSVVGFAGDALLCWFDTSPAAADPDPGPSSISGEPAWRATACALAVQAAVHAFAPITIEPFETVTLGMHIALASGPARRLVIGDPEIQWLDVLAGRTLSRMAAARSLASKDEVIVDEVTWGRLAERGADPALVRVREWRTGVDGERFAVVSKLTETESGDETLLDPVMRDGIIAVPFETLRPWILPAVYERLRAGTDELLTELRPAVAMFVRFTGIDYDVDDDAGRQLDAYICRVQRVLARYDGVLLNVIMGDKGSYLYAAFGAFTAHEDDARRAAIAALELRTLPVDLPFIHSTQIGMSQGVVRVGTYGGSTRGSYDVLGDEANLAARLMEAAQPGEILMSATAYRAIGSDFTCQAIPPLRLKGINSPIKVWTLQGIGRAPTARLQEPVYTLPMVGREQELALIADKLDRVWQGQGQIVGISSEAGLGKSRLVAEVIRLVAETGRFARREIAMYAGACQSYGTHSPYLVWRPIWRGLLGIDPAAPVAEQVAALEQALAAMDPTFVSRAPLLSLLLDIPIPDNDLTRSLDTRLRKESLEALLVDCLKAQKSAVVFFLEDVHWIDPLSYDLIETVAQASTNLRVLLVLAHRPTQPGEFATTRLEALPHFSSIRLTELSPAESAQLIQAKVEQLYAGYSIQVPDAVMDRLTVQAQGNPLYLEELLNYLYDHDLSLYQADTVDRLDLPNSLHTLILSRLDQLAEREKMVLKAASIIGRLFKLEWLHGYYPALGDLEEIKSDLSRLCQLGLASGVPEREQVYLFRHIVTHQVVYESLPHTTQAQLHEQLARYLEVTYHDTPRLGMLAHHYEQSENVPKKIEYLRKAGDEARAAFANADALAYYARLLPLLNTPVEQVELRLQKGAVLELTGQWERAEAHYWQALQLAQAEGAAAAVLGCQLALGRLFCKRGEYATALNWLEHALGGWAALDDRAGLAKTVVEIGSVYLYTSDYAAAKRHLEKSLTLAYALDDQPGIALALGHLGTVALRQGDYETARALQGESLALQRTMGDKPGMAKSLNSLGAISFEQRDDRSTRAAWEASLALRREIGDKRGIADSLSNLGLLHCAEKDYAVARALLQESLVLYREMGDRKGISAALDNLGNVAYDEGDYPAARALYEESLALCRELDDKIAGAPMLIDLGMVAMAEGDTAAAIEFITESLRLRHETGDRRGTGSSLAGLGGAIFYAGDARCATRLAGAGHTLLASIHAEMEAEVRRHHERTVAAARAALGEEAFAAAWEEGARMTMEEAVAYATAAVSDLSGKRRDRLESPDAAIAQSTRGGDSGCHHSSG